MKILLTGASGFIGYNVYRYLKDNGYDVEVCVRKYFDEKFPPEERVWYGCDLTKPDIVKSILNKVKPDCIIHLAADATTKQNNANPYEIVDNNVKSAFNLLQECNSGIKFILASTVLVYGDTLSATETMPCKPTSVYGATKIACEAILNAYSSIKDIKPVSLRMCATVGKGMTHGLVKDIIRKLKDNSVKLELFGNKPGTIKPFMHVSDVSKAIEFFIKNDFTGEFNLCPNDNMSVLDIAKTLMIHLEIEKEIQWMGSDSLWKGDNPVVLCSPNKLWKAGFRPEYKNSISAITRTAWEHR